METRIKVIKYILDVIIVTLFPVLIVCDVQLAINILNHEILQKN